MIQAGVAMRTPAMDMQLFGFATVERKWRIPLVASSLVSVILFLVATLILRPSSSSGSSSFLAFRQTLEQRPLFAEDMTVEQQQRSVQDEKAITNRCGERCKHCTIPETCTFCTLILMLNHARDWSWLDTCVLSPSSLR